MPQFVPKRANPGINPIRMLILIYCSHPGKYLRKQSRSAKNGELMVLIVFLFDLKQYSWG